MRDALGTRLWLGVAALLLAVSCTGKIINHDNGHTDPPCNDGAIRCLNSTQQACTGGAWVDSQVCVGVCDDTLGCVACHPQTGTCNGNTSSYCKADGSGFTDETCDPVQGSTCDPTSGLCTGPCSALALGSSYIGCEYYPTIIGNTVANQFDYAVAISNAGNQPAMVTIEDGSLTAPVTITVAPASVAIQILPWQPDLKLCSNQTDPDACLGAQVNGALVAKGAYHLRATSPVTVYQFSALEYTLNGSFSFTNDASLLFPTNAWRKEYYVAAWPYWTARATPSELTVTATQPGTTVTLTTTASTTAAGGAPAFTAGTPQTQALEPGGVLELASTTGDLSGTHIVADHPIQVLGGHFCTNVPDGVAACDHLEESMFSVEALGVKYAVNAPQVTSIPIGKVEIVRIIATAPNTTLTYDPPQMGVPNTIANAGGVLELPSSAASFVITADHKILVAQYMEGQEAGGNTGDPAMTLAVPVEQFRSQYLFHAPISYETNYLDVTTPTGSTLTLDGVALAGATPITAGLDLYRVTLTNGPASDGNHSISGTMPFGISVYGYGQYTSYWYPGGLDLKTIVIN
jgi:hypothetical protein